MTGLYCSDPEGWQYLTWYYDVSPCVSQTVLFTLPSVVALILGSVTLWKMKENKRRRGRNWDYQVKQVSMAMLGCAGAVFAETGRL